MSFISLGPMELLVILGVLAFIFAPALIIVVVVVFYARRPTDKPPMDHPNVIACPDCGRAMSRRAEACPHCGAPTSG